MPPKGSSMWVWTSTPPGITYLPGGVDDAVGASAQRRAEAGLGLDQRDDALAVDQDVGRRSSPVALMTSAVAGSGSAHGRPSSRRLPSARRRRLSSRIVEALVGLVLGELSGGAMRSTLPYSPPLPISRPAPAGGLQQRGGGLRPGRRVRCRCRGCTSSTAEHQALARAPRRRRVRARRGARSRSTNSLAHLAGVALQVVVEQVARGWPARRRWPAGCRRRWRCWLAPQAVHRSRPGPPRRRCDRPLPTPLAKVRGRARRRGPGSPRSARRCGPSRSAPRRR